MLICYESFAASLCMSPSGSGSATGADWNNTLSWSSTTLSRGNTYYLRDGVYASKTLATAVSSTTLIIIRKATATDHVTDTGWSSSMADQAIMTPTLRISTSYYVIDGGYRDESNPPLSWTNWTAYGILITNRASLSGSDDQLWITSNNPGSPATPANNVTVSNVFVKGVYGPFPDAVTHRYAVTTETLDNSTIHTGLLFSRMGIYGANQHWFLRQTSGAIVEYSSSTDCLSRSGGTCDCNHGENVNLYFTSDGAIIRWNYFFNNFNDNPGYSHGGTAVIALTQSDNCEIYGNIFDTYFVGDGPIGFIGASGSGTKIYNNTFIRSVSGGSSSVHLGSSSTIQNNLWVSNSASPSFTATVRNYNGYSDGTHSEANGQGGIASSIFVSYPLNLKLATNTAAGTTLSAPYNTDMIGHTRGGSEDWSRGTFQYYVDVPVNVTSVWNIGTLKLN